MDPPERSEGLEQDAQQEVQGSYREAYGPGPASRRAPIPTPRRPVYLRLGLAGPSRLALRPAQVREASPAAVWAPARERQALTGDPQHRQAPPRVRSSGGSPE